MGLASGEVILVETMTVEEAKVRLATLPDCQAFCYEEPAKWNHGKVKVYFKTRMEVEENAEGQSWKSYVRKKETCKTISDKQYNRVKKIWFRKASPAKMIWFLRGMCQKLKNDIAKRGQERGAILRGQSASSTDPQRRSMSISDLADTAFDLTKREFEEVLIASGVTAMTRREIEELFDAFDTSKDRLVDIHELYAVSERLSREAERALEKQVELQQHEGAQRLFCLSALEAKKDAEKENEGKPPKVVHERKLPWELKEAAEKKKKEEESKHKKEGRLEAQIEDDVGEKTSSLAGTGTTHLSSQPTSLSCTSSSTVEQNSLAT